MAGEIAPLEPHFSSATQYNAISNDKIEESHIFEVMQTDVFYRQQFWLYFWLILKFHSTILNVMLLFSYAKCGLIIKM